MHQLASARRPSHRIPFRRLTWLVAGTVLTGVATATACSHATRSAARSGGDGGLLGADGGPFGDGSDPRNLPGIGGPVAGGIPIGKEVKGGPDPSIKTTLPSLPSLTNVLGIVGDDSVAISFDPVDGAKDYRVYALPADGDVTVGADGAVTVKNAIYRCAGTRQTHDLRNNLNEDSPDLSIVSQYGTRAVIESDEAKSVLGHVYVVGGSGRTPVYAVAGHPMSEEDGWRESRFKIYTTDEAERKRLLEEGFRDDGVVFFVPASAGAGTHTVYGAQHAGEVLGQGWMQYKQYYFNAEGKAAHEGETTPPAPAFEVLDAAATGTQPLMAVLYEGEQTHVELAVGKERFQRAAYQGNGPLWHLRWSGLTGPTTLVVEALDAGCPYQGFLSPQHLEAPPHQTFYTVEELAQRSPAGEVFINGQHAEGNRPKPLARAFLTVTPQPFAASDWDWHQPFHAGTDFGPVTEIPGCTDFNCGRWETAAFDFSAYRLDNPNNVPVFTYGQFLGQLWFAHDDFGSDVTGKVRFTAKQKATIDADPKKFLHAMMSVDIVSTDRRYPQLIISDRDAPVQEGLADPENDTVIVQPILGPSMRLEVQAFHGIVRDGPWDVNNQAPEHRLVDYDHPPNSGRDGMPPSEPPFEHAGMDRLARFDVFLSSERLYLFLDGTPAGCTQLPPAVKITGPVTVTLGDVLYHEGAEDEYVCGPTRPYGFMHEHQCTETKRHVDDFAFKNGVELPPWSEGLFPCNPY